MKKSRYIRWSILGIILIGTMILSYLHIHAGAQYPSVHAICPLGGLENLWSWLAGSANLQKLFSGTMTLFFFTIIFALLFGRAFCGNICPFGALQEFLGKVTKKKIVVPQRVDNYLRFIKYIVLAFATIMAWVTVSLWISPYDPYTAFAHIWAGSELFEENLIGFIILIIVVGGSIVIDRFFCKYLCPVGALYGGISKISPFNIERNACSDCGKCSKVCPMNINICQSKKVTSAECIACGECVNVCTNKNNEIKMTLFRKTIKPFVFVLLTVTLFFGSLLLFDRVGLYAITTPSVEEVEKRGNYIKFVDLRGSMTIEMGAKLTGKDLMEFYSIMEIPETVPKDTLLKYIVEYVPEYDFHAIKASR